MRRTKRTLLIRLVMAIVAIWVGGQVILAAVRYMNGREARQRAEAWFQQAQHDATPDTTPEDAVRWLRQHDSKAFRGEEAAVNGRLVENHVVTGYRVESRKSFWTEPMTVELTFHFDANWRFDNVELECQP